jgi:hypothetical protein
MDFFVFQIIQLLNYFLYPANFAAAQDHLDSVWMGGTFGEQLYYHTFSQGSSRLVLFFNNSHMCTNLDFAPLGSGFCHNFAPGEQSPVLISID